MKYKEHCNKIFSELLHYPYKVSNISQTEDMSGPPNPTIEADFLSYILGYYRRFLFHEKPCSGGKKLKNLERTNIISLGTCTRTSNTLGRGNGHLFVP